MPEFLFERRGALHGNRFSGLLQCLTALQAVGQLLQRTLASYRALSLTLASRGFDGEFRVYSSKPHRPSKRYAIEATLGCTVLAMFSLVLSLISY